MREFIDYSISILNDDNLYLDLKNLIKIKNLRNYENVKNDLINILNIKND